MVITSSSLLLPLLVFLTFSCHLSVAQNDYHATVINILALEATVCDRAFELLRRTATSSSPLCPSVSTAARGDGVAHAKQFPLGRRRQ